MDIRKFFPVTAARKAPANDEDKAKRPRVVDDSDEEELDGKAVVRPSPAKPASPVKPPVASAEPAQSTTPALAAAMGKPPSSSEKPKPKQDKQTPRKAAKVEDDAEEEAQVDDDDDDEEDDDDDEGALVLGGDGEKRGSASQIAALPGKYDPVAKATWKKGEPTPYAELVAVFEKIEATTKRLEIQEEISRLFRCVFSCYVCGGAAAKS